MRKPCLMCVPIVAIFVAVLLSAPAGRPDPAAIKLFRPLPSTFESAQNPITDAKVSLGRVLFFETRLSAANDVSCNSCHGLDTFGVDNRKVSEGHRKQVGNRNSPTVYNAAGQFVQFWDGRAADVETQAKGPVMNPVEMAMPSEDEVVARLKAVPGYVSMFKAAFPGESDPVTFDNMANAIGAFERKLATPARWDKYLKGDKEALTEAERAGFRAFAEAGCAACHAGTLVGGGAYQKLGAVKPWPHQNDLGRYAVTKKNPDKMSFKVPTLRNIAKTGPYFHDGSVTTLDEAVRNMAEHQCGKQLQPADVQSIITWLNALTGEVPAAFVKPPVLPR